MPRRSTWRRGLSSTRADQANRETSDTSSASLPQPVLKAVLKTSSANISPQKLARPPRSSTASSLKTREPRSPTPGSAPTPRSPPPRSPPPSTKRRRLIASPATPRRQALRQRNADLEQGLENEVAKTRTLEVRLVALEALLDQARSQAARGPTPNAENMPLGGAQTQSTRVKENLAASSEPVVSEDVQEPRKQRFTPRRNAEGLSVAQLERDLVEEVERIQKEKDSMEEQYEWALERSQREKDGLITAGNELAEQVEGFQETENELSEARGALWTYDLVMEAMKEDSRSLEAALASARRKLAEARFPRERRQKPSLPWEQMRKNADASLPSTAE